MEQLITFYRHITQSENTSIALTQHKGRNYQYEEDI